MIYSSNNPGDNQEVCKEHDQIMELVSLSPDGEGVDLVCWDCWNRNHPESKVSH